MRFYEATRFLFPRHYERRILAICFCAVHLPLIAGVVVLGWRADWDVSLLLVLLVATLIGTIGAIMSISALLAPIQRATTLLQNVRGGLPVEGVPIGGEDLVGKLLHGVAHAANENARRVKLLKDAAERDVLTGLRNRRGFLDAVAPLLAHEKRGCVALIDIDHFKAVNDEYGHDRGDRILTDFADHLSVQLRRSDLSARWGGEEFIVFFPDTGTTQANEILARLQAVLRGSPDFRVGDRAVTVSCGVSVVANYADLAAATRRADDALYGAKEGGRDLILVAR
jgi:diguanylate cyclase (GGDEF)-like protein